MKHELPERLLADAYRAFHEAEIKHNLVFTETEIVPAWRLVRGAVYMHILEREGLFERGESAVLGRRRRFSLAIAGIARNLLSPIRWLGIFSGVYVHTRKGIQKLVGGAVEYWSKPHLDKEPINALVVGFIRGLPGNIRLTEPVEAALDNNYLLVDKPDAGMFRTNRISFKHIDRLSARYRHEAERLPDFSEFSRIVGEIYDVEPAFVLKNLNAAAKSFIAQKAVFSQIIRKRKPGCVYLAWNRSYFAVISAAQEARIPVYEFQHGIVNKIHSQYSWNTKILPPAYPDFILSPGKGWASVNQFPAEVRSIDIGSHHMDAMLERYGAIRKKPGSVVVFSQKVIGIQLFRFIVAVARLCPEMRFCLKLHPNERYLDPEYYIEGKLPANVELASGIKDSYQLMAESEFQIGVSSTTLVEGLKFGLKTLIVPLVSWEYMENWIMDGQMHLTATPGAAADLLKSDVEPPSFNNDWYGPSTPQNIPLP